jgi:hypothetical protein
MTDVVRPSNGANVIDAQIARTSIHGGGRQSYIPSTVVPLLRDESGDFAGEPSLGSGASNQFAVASSSSSSLDVTIEGGEAIVEGAALARDTQTTVTLAASTNDQTVYVGWERDTTDSVVIGLVSDFAAKDRRMPIFDIDTDESGVTAITDRRPAASVAIGGTALASGISATAVGFDTRVTADTSTALGGGAEATAERATAVGRFADVGGARSVALGADTTVTTGTTNAYIFGEGGTVDTNDTARFDGLDVTVTGELTVETLLTVPTLGSDPSNPGDGTVWYRTDLDEYRGVEDGTTVTFRTDSRAEVLVDSPNGGIPTALLEATESVEISVPVPDGETLKVYRWGAYKISDGTAPAGLNVQLLDGSDTVQASANTTNAENTASPVTSHANSSGSLSVFKLAINNNTGSDFTTDGVGGTFAYLVE